MLNTSLIDHIVNRRNALKTVAGAGAAALATTDLPAEAGTIMGGSSKIDFDDPAQNLNAWAKVLGNTDPTVETLSWFGGHIFAVQKDKPLLKLVGVEGIGVLRIEPQGGDVFRLFNREMAFYKDPNTEEIVDVWRNPLIDEEVEVVPIHNMTVNAEIAPIQKMDFDGTMVEQPFNPPWWVLGDSAMSLFEVHAVFPSPMKVEDWPRESAGPISRISEIFQRFSSLAEIEDESKTSADYVGTWTRIGPWLPWMLMGQADGHILYRTYMKKLASKDQLTPNFREKVEERFPEYFQAPGPETWGGRNDSSFSVYMEERTPQPPKT